MAIPDFQSVMLPLLKELGDGQEKRTRDVTETLATVFGLTPDEREALLPSGQQTVLNNRVQWAKTYLKAAGLLEAPARGKVRITPQGHAVLSQNPSDISMRYLEQFPTYVEFRDSSRTQSGGDSEQPAVEVPGDSRVTPLEQLAASIKTLDQATKADLLTRLKECSPRFFERAVVTLLRAMGYGIDGDSQVTGAPGDGGIDGIIREDKLGLDVVCLQAKRYSEASVGRPAVQQFVGSMDMHRSRKGVILTTSTFSRDATAFIDRIEGKKVVLIDGNELANLMVKYNVGVTTTNTYEVKEVSNDFFDEDDA